jgi:hypothetical protein
VSAGYRYDITILQAELSLTQVLDRPVTGRAVFEEVIRENLDIGRPSQAQLIVERRVSRRTPGRFRTRVITEGVIPSLHVDYKSSRIKQYHESPQTAWSFRSHFSEAQPGTAGFGAHRAAICWGILGRWMVLHNVGRAGNGISAVYFR